MADASTRDGVPRGSRSTCAVAGSGRRRSPAASCGSGTLALALATRTLRILSARGLRIAGRAGTVRAATPHAIWTMTEAPRGTRVRVLRGAVRAGDARVPAGRVRVL